MPHLFYISDGQRKGTLIFHVKIEKKCYELILRKVSKKYCILFCVNKDCKARTRIALRSEFIFQKVEKASILKHLTPRKIGVVNRDDKRLKNLSNWKVRQFDSALSHLES